MVKKKVSGRKGQTWSMDLVVGVVIFLLLVVVLYSLLATEGPEDEKLRIQSEQVLTRIDAENNDTMDLPGVVVGNTINEEALKELYASGSYEDIKAKLGIEGEVCIMIVDDTGGIIQFDVGGNDKLSFGNTGDNLEITPGVYCGE